jgi:hypothetical protein
MSSPFLAERFTVDDSREFPPTQLPKEVLCKSYTLRTATRKVYNAVRTVMQSVQPNNSYLDSLLKDLLICRRDYTA